MPRARPRSAPSTRKPKARPTPKGGRPAPVVVPGARTRPSSPPPLLSEPPHAHIVCRVCGRIAEVPLETQDQLLLERLAHHRPDGWSVDLIAFSLTGACARCREGPAAPA